MPFQQKRGARNFLLDLQIACVGLGAPKNKKVLLLVMTNGPGFEVVTG